MRTDNREHCMQSTASQLFSYILVAIAIVLTGWGALGFVEYLTGYAPVVPLQNPAFPAGTQFLHWVLILLAGLVFLFGYFGRWRRTPEAMLVLYAMMAGLCFVQTFDFMTNPGRYLAMALEYAAYAAISLYLFRSERMKRRFDR